MNFSFCLLVLSSVSQHGGLHSNAFSRSHNACTSISAAHNASRFAVPLGGAAAEEGVAAAPTAALTPCVRERLDISEAMPAMVGVSINQGPRGNLARQKMAAGRISLDTTRMNRP